MEKKIPSIHFGTDGIRGKVETFPFTPDALEKIGLAIAQWAKEKYKKKVSPPTTAPHVLIGHDTRMSCTAIKNIFNKIFLQTNIRCTDGGELPTPAVLKVIQENNLFDFGIVISASHNPYTDNGIKIFDAKTGKLSRDDEKIIEQYFLEQEINRNQTDLFCKVLPSTAETEYKKNVTKHFEQNFLAEKKIVLDCANGATYKIAPEIFSSLGADIISLNTNPDGKNINEKCGSLHPEMIINAVLEQNADIGFAFDGDGDRVVAINKNGEIKDGDDILAILLEHKDFQSETAVVGTVMTNYGLQKYLLEKNRTLIRTKVGDKYVSAMLEDKNILLGGENSGHVIIKNYMNSGDAIFVALKTLESAIQNDNLLLKSFPKIPQILINIPVTQKKQLDQHPYTEIIEKHEKNLMGGRVLVRYSGTENLLRVMVEDQTVDSAQKIAENLGCELQRELEKNI